jgi:hypothetical protein
MLYIVVTNVYKLLDFLSFLGALFNIKEFVIEHCFFKMQKICHDTKKNITTSPF